MNSGESGASDLLFRQTPPEPRILETNTFHRARLADSMPGTIRLARKKPVTGGISPAKKRKKRAPARDTRLAVGRELTKGNSIFPFFEDRNRTDCSAVNLTGAVQTMIGNLRG